MGAPAGKFAIATVVGLTGAGWCSCQARKLHARTARAAAAAPIATGRAARQQ